MHHLVRSFLPRGRTSLLRVRSVSTERPAESPFDSGKSGSPPAYAEPSKFQQISAFLKEHGSTISIVFSSFAAFAYATDYVKRKDEAIKILQNDLNTQKETHAREIAHLKELTDTKMASLKEKGEDLVIAKEKAEKELAIVKENLATVRENLATVRENLATVRENLATVRENLATVREKAEKDLALRTEELSTKFNSKLLDLGFHGDFERYRKSLASVSDKDFR